MKEEKKSNQPKFNIYWIYGAIIFVLLGLSLFGGNDWQTTSKTNMKLSVALSSLLLATGTSIGIDLVPFPDNYFKTDRSDELCIVFGSKTSIC